MEEVRFELDRSAAGVAAVADLVDRESQCCAFFTFVLTIGAEALSLSVGAEAGHGDVVAALATRASALAVAGQA